MNTEQIYKAWQAVGADLAGLKWDDFVEALAWAQQEQPEQEPVFDCPRCGHCCPQRKPLTREQEIALREGYCADAESSYFGARADCIDTPQNRRLFGAGFERGWQAAHGIKENT